MRPKSHAVRGLATVVFGSAVLAGTALAQDTVTDTMAVPAAPAATQQNSPAPAAAPGPIVIPAQPAPPPEAKFRSGHLVSCEGLFFYSSWKETETHYGYLGAVTPAEYKNTSSVLAALIGYNYLMPSGLAVGGTLGIASFSSSRKLVSGSSGYYYSDAYSSSASLNLFGPRIGYYFTSLSGKVTPFAAFEYDIISGSYNLSENVARIGGGVLIQVAPSAAISVGVDYVDISDLKNATNVMGLVGMNFLFQ